MFRKLLKFPKHITASEQTYNNLQKTKHINLKGKKKGNYLPPAPKGEF